MKQTGKLTDTPTDTYMHIDIQIQTGRQTDGQKFRQTDV